MNKSQVGVIIPAYNESKAIGKILNILKNNGYKNILVIDDGSSDNTYEVARKAGVNAVRHSLNRGLGGALGTGLKLAVNMRWPIMVTFDADGQHDVADIERVCLPILHGKADVVIGSRMRDSRGVLPMQNNLSDGSGTASLSGTGMPWHRRILNFMGNLVTYAFFGIWCSDTQSGLRAFSLDAAKRIHVKTNRMEVSSEIIREIHVRGLKMVEVPIKAIYTNYSLSKGQSFYTGVKTFLKLLLHRLMH